MQPRDLRFGGGATETVLSPLVAVAVALAIVLILCLPRKYAIVPLLLATFTIPLGQVVVLGGMHFTMIRVLILAGLARRVVSGRSPGAGGVAGGFNPMDRVVTLWAAIGVITVPLQFMQGPALVQALGDCLDALEIGRASCRE